MRVRKSGLVTVQAVSGTHCVLFGFDMNKADTRGLLGFAIRRTELNDDKETVWLRSSKTFPSLRESTAYDDVSSYSYPFQAFQWADYTAKPGFRYEYRVLPMYGKPGALSAGKATTFSITAEKSEGRKHSVYFNRGAIASQAYTKRFGPNPPDKAGTYAWEWLARDLLPGLLAFIARAKSAGYSLNGAIFETHLPEVLDAFRAAHLRKAKVDILYEATAGTDTAKVNGKAIKAAGVTGLFTPRKKGRLAHNKFIVLSYRNKPIAVWTGSTNLSTNAIYGQLNVGHAIEDAALAGQFLKYWHTLKTDPDNTNLKDWTEASNPVPEEGAPVALLPLFSPHRGRAYFDWMTATASTARQALFMTFPFGIVKDFRPVFNHKDRILRFALLDKYVNGGTRYSRKKAIAEIIKLRRLPNVGMAVGSSITMNSIDGWLKEAAALGTFVNWVHTKFMLIDPLGDHPVTVSGSANWSQSSTTDNDENMVVVNGDKRVADIYLTEFMRIFSHHRFRESLEIHLRTHHTLEDWKPRDLAERWEDWGPKHYVRGSEYEIKRRYFAGTV